jgi:hypothetical protein
MPSPINRDNSFVKGYDFISEEEAQWSYSQVQEKNEAAKQEFASTARSAGDSAGSYAPALLTQALAFTLLSYLSVFRILGFLKWNVASYAVPAAVAVNTHKLTENLQPLTHVISKVANVAVRNSVACAQIATRSQMERYQGPSAFEILKAVNC